MINSLNDMNLNRFLIYIRRLDKQSKQDILENEELYNLDMQKFNFLIFSIEEDEIGFIINNKKIYDKVLNIQTKNKNRTILNLLSEQKPFIFKALVESYYSKDYIDKFIFYLKNLSYESLKTITNEIDFGKIIKYYFCKDYNNYYNLYFNLKNKFGNNDNFDDVFNLFKSKSENNLLNLSYLLHINNFIEFILFTKFNILVNIELKENQIIFENGFVISNEAIMNVKDSHINKLISLVENKPNQKKVRDSKIIEIVLKLYYIFGFDGAKKIIEDKFSNITESAIVKISDFNFKDDRRTFRIKNQNKFYNHEMIKQVLDSLSNNDDEIFKILSYNHSEESIENIKKEFLTTIENCEDKNKLNELIKEKINEKIKIRENEYKLKTFSKIKQRLSNKEKQVLSVDDLYELFKNVNLNKVINYDKVTLESLKNLLLGNEKVNNDCLLRIIINQEAFGLNDNLHQIINSYDIIKSICDKSGISLYSILNIIDIMKTNLYNLKPNEQDIYLSTITKIVNSTKYITNFDIDRVSETCKLHLERKKKIYSSIPIVSGKVGNMTYKVAPFDAEYLLTAGIDAKNCLRVGGLGEAFYRYCLTSPNGAIVYLEYESKQYICPIIRTGNMINCNDIAPIYLNTDVDMLLETLKGCFIHMIKESSRSDDPILAATISNNALRSYFNNKNYEQIKFSTSLPIDCDCYNDINKDDIENYIICKTEDFEPKYYLSKSRYYQKRDLNYEYTISKEYDQENLSLIVNSIYYSSIDYQNISEKEKYKRKQSFIPLDVSKFKYIIGNKDWYIAIDDNYNVLANLLPYDSRAKSDYINALANIPSILEKLTIEENYDKENKDEGENIRKNK